MRPLALSRRALVPVLPLLFSACNDGNSQAARVLGPQSEFGGLAADPERHWFIAGDAASGRLVVVDGSDGALQFDLPGNGIGISGLRYDPCTRSLYAALARRGRLQVYDPATLVLRNTLLVPEAPFALANAPAGALLMVTTRGLLHFDPATQARTTLLPAIAPDALLATSRDATIGFAAETFGTTTVVHRFDLTQLGAPPIDNSGDPLDGELVALALDEVAGRLFVGTASAPGIHVLDATTLALQETIDVGDGLTGMALSTTGLRLFWTTDAPLVESVIVEPRFEGPSVALLEAPRPRGLVLADDNQELAVWSAAGTLATYPIRDFWMQAPAAFRQGATGTMTLKGEPNAAWFLFLSGEAAPLVLDRKNPGPDPRLLELSLSAGFQLAASGTFDANGDATLSDEIPTGLPDPVELVFQAVQTQSLVNRRYTLSNAQVVRILGPECQ
ncbi:MAG: hypothetical protein JNL90_03190 [Planctomycetes bacterium]|nr:hypothetical protein [Planctomycetota bacterium]